MFAVYASGVNAEDPLSCLALGELSPPPTPEDWVTVDVKAVSVNHHDLWALRGTALTADQAPMILGTDAAGVTEDGRAVIRPRGEAMRLWTPSARCSARSTRAPWPRRSACLPET